MKNKKILTVATIVLALLLFGVGYIAFTRNQDDNLPSTPEELRTIDYGPSKPTDKVQPSSKDEIINGTNTEDAAPSNLSVTITAASQSENVVRVRALVDGSLEGVCQLKLEYRDSTLTKEAPYGPQASYAICQGFNITLDEFPESGKWKIVLTAISKEGKKASTVSYVEVKK